MTKQVVITDAFFELDGHFFLNPALSAYEKELLKMKQVWSTASDVTPLAWLARCMQCTPAALLASLTNELPQQSKQYWVASPYHARLTRSMLRVMPDSMLDWDTNHAQQMCAILNPLLSSDGLELHVIDDTLLLSCNRSWDVNTAEFAEISGASLPDKHPKGKDAGHWMRLASEIQMTLHQQPVHNASGVAMHGLWFWGKTDDGALSTKLDFKGIPSIATRNIYLKSVLKTLNKEQDATHIVTEAEHLPLLLNASAPKPKDWLLLGAGKSVKLTNSVFIAALNTIKAQTWKGIK